MRRNGPRRADEVRFLLANSRLAADMGHGDQRHLASAVSLFDYVRIADEVAELAAPGPLLDWGCGYGQMCYLLAARGMEVVGYDVGRGFAEPRLPLTRGLTAVRGEHRSALPFGDATFATVLSCGVLEHVADEDASLRDIHRVLVPGGRLVIYNLAQRGSYKEVVIRGLRLGFTHDRRHSVASISAALRRNGFEVVGIGRAGVLPHLCTALPESFTRVYQRLGAAVIAVDRTLSRLPPMAAVAQSIQVVAERSRASDERLPLVRLRPA